jgi:GntR family transcriptional repressor for pyruvate dehydrogenase complex
MVRAGYAAVLTSVPLRAYGPALSDKQTPARSAVLPPAFSGALDRRRVSELLAATFVDRIVDGALHPGEPIPTERELTEAFSVGRSSVREALRILESRGLIVGDRHGRFAVAEPTEPLHRSLELLITLDGADFAELFEVRNILEVESAGLAASRRTELDLDALGDAAAAMRQSLGSADRYIEADLRFHVGIAHATGNRITAHLMHAIRDLLGRALVEIFRIPGSPESSVEQHRWILEAIEARDPVAARARMREHLTKVESEVRAAIGAPAAPTRAPSAGTTRGTGETAGKTAEEAAGETAGARGGTR